MLLVLMIFSALSFAQQIHFGNESFDISRFFQVLISSTWMSPYWYLYTYIGFLLTLPLLRRLAKAMKNSDYWYMAALVIIVTGFVPIIMYIASIGTLKLNSDFSISWISSQICFYPLLGYYLENGLDIDKVSGKMVAMMWVINILSMLLTCYVTNLNNNLQGGFPQTYMMSLAPIHALCLYITVRRLLTTHKFGKTISYLIQQVGVCTFGIYLFHGLLLRDSRLSLYLKIEQLFDFAPLLRESLRCIEIMIIGCFATWLLKKLPGVRKLL